VVGYHHFGLVTGKFCWCLARAVAYEGGRIKACLERGGPYTDQARNQLIEDFLALPPVDYFLMVDADIEFEKDAISKTMWVAQNFGADVVWGNYALGDYRNSLFVKDPFDNTELAGSLDNLKPNMVYEGIYGGGTGWCMIHRDLLVKMRCEFDQTPWPWFGRDIITDKDGTRSFMGEDLTFGKRAHQIGAKQVGYTGVLLIHHKAQPMVPSFMTPVAQEIGRDVKHAGPMAIENKSALVITADLQKGNGQHSAPLSAQELAL
jgi:hypothetical protein